MKEQGLHVLSHHREVAGFCMSMSHYREVAANAPEWAVFFLYDTARLMLCANRLFLCSAHELCMSL